MVQLFPGLSSASYGIPQQTEFSSVFAVHYYSVLLSVLLAPSAEGNHVIQLRTPEKSSKGSFFHELNSVNVLKAHNPVQLSC